MVATTGGTLNPARDGGPRLRLLGPVKLDGPVSLRFLPERRYRLMAYVALRGEWVSRDELANLFWPDRTQEAARSNLRKLLLEVRALDFPSVESDRNGMRWNVSTDVAEYKSALERGDANAAFALYRGPPLHGLDGGDSQAFSTWLANERARLHAAWHDAVVAEFPHRDPAGVLELAHRLLADDPYDEDAMVAALDALGARGDGPAAAEAFRSYAERLIEELGVEPSVRARAAVARATGPVQQEAALHRRRATDASGSAATALPAAGLIGRARELEELSALLANPECRLLTVTGPGGMGKSRLIKEAVRRLEAHYADGVTWIALDDLTEVAQVAPRVTSALGIDLAPKQDPVERIAAHLATRHALLVLDNSEHLPRLSTLIERLLAAAPRLQVLTTSRTRIGVDHEWLMPLEGLTLPSADGSTNDIVAADAVQLFIAHARATDPRFNIDANVAHIATLVRAVGGLPLAILLAASWIRFVPMFELAQEVTQSLDVLERAEEGDERPEHRSVRATFEQSWRLLAPAEQRALAALSVMAGSFTRSAAKEVAQAPLPLLAALVDKSLLQVDAQGRFSLHPLIRQFAAEKLALDPAVPDVVRDRHAEAFARFMAQYELFDAGDQAAAVRAIAAELSNVLAAWNWSITRPRIDVMQRCMAGLSNYLQWRGPIAVGLELFERAQVAIDAHADSITGAARNAFWGIPFEQAALSYSLGDYRRVEACARKALEAARAIPYGFGVRASLNLVALALMRLGRIAEGARYHEEALAGAVAAHVAWEVAAYSGELVEVKRELGDDEEALHLALAARDAHRAAGQKAGEIAVTNSIGLILHSLGRFSEAIDAYDDGLRSLSDAGMEVRRATFLSHKASACLDAGELDRARHHVREALEVVQQTDLRAAEPTCRRTLADIALASGDIKATLNELRIAIVAARHDGTANVIGLQLRSCAAYFERVSDAATALRCVACADAHRFSAARMLYRYRGQRERLIASLETAARVSAEAEGAALTLQAGLDLAERSLGTA